MREMLEPIFGESGAVVAQFIITLIVVLALIGLGYWLFRRLAGARFKGTGRGRIPRLAIIDALAVDTRRKLVLIRRDNVEHLLLIGGTSDLVIEPAIMRTVPASARARPGQAPRPQPQSQSPAQQPSTDEARPAPAPPQPSAAQRRNETGISQPIPFPQAQRPHPRPAPRGLDAHRAQPERGETVTSESIQQRRTAVRPAPAPVEPPVHPAAANGERGAVASAHFEEPARPSRVESVLSLAETLDEIADEPHSSDGTTEFAGPRARPAPGPSPQPKGERTTAEAKDMATPHVVEPSVKPSPATTPGAGSARAGQQRSDEEGGTAQVGDLEREMARLLGEITAKRD